MADKYSCSINTDMNATGNMYFKGTWEYCPEYRTGDVVLHNDRMYMCTKPHAGKEPELDGSANYWYSMTPESSSESSAGSMRRILDGGFASTSGDDKYDGTIDGGTSSGRLHIPLV